MLPITEYPSIVKDREMYLRPAFAFRNQIDNCMRYLTGLIVLPERKNVSSISRSFVDSKDQASVNNFITDSTWSEELFHDAAIRMVKDEVEKQKVNHGIVVIDDTHYLKRQGNISKVLGYSGTMYKGSTPWLTTLSVHITLPGHFTYHWILLSTRKGKTVRMTLNSRPR
jgi:DDE superfamily endonuclease